MQSCLSRDQSISIKEIKSLEHREALSWVSECAAPQQPESRQWAPEALDVVLWATVKCGSECKRMLHGALLAFEAGLTRQSPQLSPDPSHWANPTQPDAPARFLGAESEAWQLTLICSLGAE